MQFKAMAAFLAAMLVGSPAVLATMPSSLARAYTTPRGPEQTALFKAACDENLAAGCYMLAVRLEATRDPGMADAMARALRLWDSDCTAGRSEGCWNLAIELLTVRPGTTGDEPRSRLIYLRIAGAARDECARGMAEGCKYLGQVLSTAKWGQLSNLSDARAAYAKGCRGTRSDSQTHTLEQLRAFNCLASAKMLENGQGGPKSPTDARAAFKAACALKVAEACTVYTGYLQEGIGGAKDTVAARRMYETACQAGSSDDCFGLANQMTLGIGGPMDAPRATTIFEKLCRQGSKKACLEAGIKEFRGDDPDDE